MATRSDYRRRYRRAKTAKTRRRIWCEALESGLWPQGTGQLCIRDDEPYGGEPSGFCCLGVAEDLAGRLRGREEEPDLLWETAFEMRLSDCDGSYDGAGEGSWDCLSNLNDKDGETFPEIAAFIRSEPAGLLAEED